MILADDASAALLLAALRARYAMLANVYPLSMRPSVVCRRQYVVRLVVISRKLSSIDPQLLWNTI